MKLYKPFGQGIGERVLHKRVKRDIRPSCIYEDQNVTVNFLNWFVSAKN